MMLDRGQVDPGAGLEAQEDADAFAEFRMGPGDSGGLDGDGMIGQDQLDFT